MFKLLKLWYVVVEWYLEFTIIIYKVGGDRVKNVYLYKPYQSNSWVSDLAMIYLDYYYYNKIVQ